MAAQNYRIRIVRPDLELEAEGDKRFVSDILARFSATPEERPKSEAPARGAKAATGSTLPGAARGVSAGEFIRQFGFKRHTDIVLAFGYYLDHHTGLKEFSPADINNVYYEAKMESSNTSQAIIYNIRRGYLMQAKGPKGTGAGRKKYTLTDSGEGYLRTRLQKASEKPTK